MIQDDEITFTLKRDEGLVLRDVLSHSGIETTQRNIRGFAGETELLKIAVVMGGHIAKNLVDALTHLVRNLFRPEKPTQADRTSSTESAEATVTVTIRRGGMVLSIENAPLEEVKRVLAQVDAK